MKRWSHVDSEVQSRSAPVIALPSHQRNLKKSALSHVTLVGGWISSWLNRRLGSVFHWPSRSPARATSYLVPPLASGPSRPESVSRPGATIDWWQIRVDTGLPLSGSRPRAQAHSAAASGPAAERRWPSLEADLVLPGGEWGDGSWAPAGRTVWDRGTGSHCSSIPSHRHRSRFGGTQTLARTRAGVNRCFRSRPAEHPSPGKRRRFRSPAALRRGGRRIILPPLPALPVPGNAAASLPREPDASSSPGAYWASRGSAISQASPQRSGGPGGGLERGKRGGGGNTGSARTHQRTNARGTAARGQVARTAASIKFFRE